jgi:hypothetical protein
LRSKKSRKKVKSAARGQKNAKKSSENCKKMLCLLRKHPNFDGFDIEQSSNASQTPPSRVSVEKYSSNNAAIAYSGGRLRSQSVGQRLTLASRHCCPKKGPHVAPKALTLFKNTKKRSNFRSLSTAKGLHQNGDCSNALAFIFRTDQNPARKSLMEALFLRKSDAKQGVECGSCWRMTKVSAGACASDAGRAEAGVPRCVERSGGGLGRAPEHKPTRSFHGQRVSDAQGHFTSGHGP